jgi:hypothetical protein
MAAERRTWYCIVPSIGEILAMRPTRATLLAATVAASLVTLSTCARVDEPTRARTPAAPAFDVAPAADPVVVAAGDIVCGTGTLAGLPCKQAATAALIGQVNPAAVLLLGDNQYENATLSDFNTYYAPTWGVYKSITFPAAGNHEYQTAGAAGYFDYFNGPGAQTGRAGDRSKGYYSVNVGSWHIVALNSNCDFIDGCGSGSPQEQWLRADLAANPAVCTLAFWHHPRFSSGSHGNNASMQAIWQALYDNGADLVLAGHDHDFERFAPQTATGVLDNARGLRSFVLGTGGKETAAFGTIRANSELRNNSSLGVLKLTLHATSLDWLFVPVPGNTLADAGTAQCHDNAPPPPPPTQATLTVLSSADAYTLKGFPSSNFGGGGTLLVDGSPVARTYLKFVVTGIGTRTVVSARLRLYAVDPSDAGGRLHRVPTTTWGETTIKWSNAPAYDAAVIGAIGSVVVNNWYEVDVKGQVNGDGTVSFALESTSTNGADYRARESGSTTAPRLVIVVQ